MGETLGLKRTAFITGDVHHPPDFIKRIWYGEPISHIDRELKVSLEYAKILSEFNAQSTLFITGKALDMSPDIIKKIIRLGNIEIGAHTYYAFRGPLYGYTTLIPLYASIFGTVYGPKFLIRNDVYRTVQALKRLGLKATSWRTHGYIANEYLYQLLAELGFKIVSDYKANDFKISMNHGLVHIYINIYDDDLPLLSQRGRLEWYKKYMRILEMKSNYGEPLVLQLHPIYMTLDNFEFFMNAVKKLTRLGYCFLKLSELLHLL